MGRVCYCIRYLVSVILSTYIWLCFGLSLTLLLSIPLFLDSHTPLRDGGVAGARIGVTDISRSLGPGIRNLGLMFAMDMVPGTDISMRQVLLCVFPCLCLPLPLLVSAYLSLSACNT